MVRKRLQIDLQVQTGCVRLGDGGWAVMNLCEIYVKSSLHLENREDGKGRPARTKFYILVKLYCLQTLKTGPER